MKRPEAWLTGGVPGRAGLLVLMTAQMAAGIATLVLGGSAVVSFLHEVGAVVLLAGAFLTLPRQSGEMSRA